MAMNIRTLINKPVTPEFVLEVIRDEHRQQCELDPEADPDAILTFKTTVAEWQQACDLIEPEPLGEALNSSWKIELPTSLWKAALTPNDERTLRDVCELIAAHAELGSATVPVIQGLESAPAGMFFAVREILEKGGADVTHIRPSSPLEPFSREPWLFLGPISRLAPGRLPLATFRQPLYNVALALFVVSALVALVVGGPALMLVVATYLVLWVVARFSIPRRVEFGNLKTFRELCEVLAADSSNSKLTR